DTPRLRAVGLAKANGAGVVRVTSSGERIRIDVTRRIPGAFGAGRRTIRASAWVELPPVMTVGDAGPNPPGVYSGPLVNVEGVRACPAVAAAWSRMDAAAARDEVVLTPTSGFRGYAEQAILFARLGPGLAAPPGTSRHHDATEFDVNVGPAGSPTHRWLQTHGPSHGFIQRYSWEPWHWGYVAGC
ncbi:MAG: peptidase and DD-carboxypeptidase VanY/endolysin, partial [Thermoleophilia bacterium]|nr:peptidase and DD-carboxypeptidase VanY/endolysin [Thermoleophilia bacterium]